MVIYFTGTGNSKFVATAIADQLGAKTIAAKDAIKSRKKGNYRSDNPWIFVFPVYLSTIPEIFRAFIKRSSFAGSKKAYFIASCASSMGASINACAELCEDIGMEFMGAEQVQMPQNYIALFSMTEAEECKRRYNEAVKTVTLICERIRKGERLTGKQASKAEYVATKAVEKMYNGPFTSTKKFYAKDSCVGCGICEKVCPLNKITIADKQPQWKGTCIHCMACINSCPKKAIEYGKGSVGKDRYQCVEYSEYKRRNNED